MGKPKIHLRPSRSQRDCRRKKRLTLRPEDMAWLRGEASEDADEGSLRIRTADGGVQGDIHRSHRCPLLHHLTASQGDRLPFRTCRPPVSIMGGSKSAVETPSFRQGASTYRDCLEADLWDYAVSVRKIQVPERLP